MKPYGFIYITKCLLDGKQYIGQRRYNKGWKEYLGSGKYLLRAIRKYGRDMFSREIILVSFDKEFLNDMEINYIREFDAVRGSEFYNLSDGGHGSTRGFLGKKHTLKTKNQMRLSQLGHPVSGKTKLAVSKAHKGKKRTHESIKKQKNSIRGRKHFRAKSVLIGDKFYDTITEAAKQTGMSHRKIRILAGLEQKPGRNHKVPVWFLGIKYSSITSAMNDTGHGFKYIKKYGEFRRGDL